MSWYDYKQWKQAIRVHRNTNTPHAFIRGITRSISWGSLLHYQTRYGTGIERKLDLLMNIYSWFLSHSHIANLSTFHQVRKITEQIHELDEDSRHIQTLYERLCTCMPHWFAEGIVNGKIPIPDTEYFEHMSYSISDDVLEDFRTSLPNMNIQRLLIHTEIANRDIFNELLFTTNRNDIPSLLSQMNSTNIEHITMDCMDKLLSVYSFPSINELASVMTNPVNLYRSSISVLYIYENCYEVWECTSHEHLFQWVTKNPILTTEEVFQLSHVTGRRLNHDIYSALAIYHPHIVFELIRMGKIVDTRNDLMYNLSMSQTITINDVLDFQHLSWDWEVLSRNPVIATPENINTYSQLPWVWGRWGISASPSLTEEFIEENFERLNKSVYPYDGGSLLQNPSITTSIVDNHPEVEWDYTNNGLSNNSNVKLDYFLRNIRQNWDLYSLIQNISLCEETAARAIQSCWRIHCTHKKAKWLANEVVEWMFHPDCKPAMKIRKKHFEEHANSLTLFG